MQSHFVYNAPRGSNYTLKKHPIHLFKHSDIYQLIIRNNTATLSNAHVINYYAIMLKKNKHHRHLPISYLTPIGKTVFCLLFIHLAIFFFIKDSHTPTWYIFVKQ